MNAATQTAPTKVTCPKCDGSGKLRHFMHIDNGRCFMCAGAGKIEVDTRKVASTFRRDPAQERQSFINTFTAALRTIREEGIGYLDQQEGFDPYSGRTERERIQGWLSAPRCPADVRARALSAFAAMGVEFS